MQYHTMTLRMAKCIENALRKKEMTQQNRIKFEEKDVMFVIDAGEFYEKAKLINITNCSPDYAEQLKQQILNDAKKAELYDDLLENSNNKTIIVNELPPDNTRPAIPQPKHTLQESEKNTKIVDEIRKRIAQLQEKNKDFNAMIVPITGLDGKPQYAWVETELIIKELQQLLEGEKK